MFCWNCGAKLPEKSKFCMNCGAKVELVAAISNSEHSPSYEQQEKIPSSVSTPICFSFQGTTLEYSNAFQKYTTRRKNFANQIEPFVRHQKEHVEKAISELGSNNIDDCADIFAAFGLDVSNKLIDTVHQGLMKEKIYTVSRSTVSEMYNNVANCFSNTFDFFFEKYLGIVNDAEQLKRYREIKRAGRSYWQGGGFGLKGAIKGAITAGALNVGTGLVRSLGDALVDAKDRNKIYNNKKAFLQNKPWAQFFESSLIDDMYQMFDVYAELLSKNGKLEIPDFDIMLSQTYFENGKHNSNQSEKKELFIKAIQAYPYSGKVYTSLAKMVGYTNQDLLIILDYFLASHQIREYTKMLFDLSYYKVLKTINGDSYDDLDKKIALTSEQLAIVKQLKGISASFQEACASYENTFGNTRNQLQLKRLTSDDGIHFQNVEDLNQYLEERGVYKALTNEINSQIVPLVRQNELLSKAELQNFHSPIFLKELSKWKERLAKCYEVEKGYPKSFEDYYSKLWPNSNADKVKASIPTEVQKALVNCPNISITKILSYYRAKIYPRLLSISFIEAWLLVSDFYIAVIIPDRSESYIVQSRELKQILFQQDILLLCKVNEYAAPGRTP